MNAEQEQEQAQTKDPWIQPIPPGTVLATLNGYITMPVLEPPGPHARQGSGSA